MGTPSPDRRALGGPAHPTCFALCSSLFHDVLQTHNGPGPIRRPASADLTEHPCSVGLLAFERRGSQQAPQHQPHPDLNRQH